MTGSAAAPGRPRPIPHTVWLVVVGVAGLSLATALSLAALAITNRTWDEVGDAERVAALSAGAQVSVTLGIVALVGATVLAGVAQIATRSLADRAHDREGSLE
ncbi:hypothetical protein [Microbacterium gallinarum]|uniref:Dinucleotide-utilizing enzyme n=1 Tax=Microbacterium gallinarum TaxID=2762209 RepID=A0ABR8X106_9MICO|nr:hypothetical protein [Microbacterium gallinarum]MBD8022953.1 hypothetical protein [Microbacterium gallinarum]